MDVCWSGARARQQAKIQLDIQETTARLQELQQQKADAQN
eukprot:SAG31_NODE_46695_length_253_cov_0.759740_1_plen_39_part_01